MRGCMDFPTASQRSSCLSVLEHQKQPYLGPPDEGRCIFRYMTYNHMKDIAAETCIPGTRKGTNNSSI